MARSPRRWRERSPTAPRCASGGRRRGGDRGRRPGRRHEQKPVGLVWLSVTLARRAERLTRSVNLPGRGRRARPRDHRGDAPVAARSAAPAPEASTRRPAPALMGALASPRAMSRGATARLFVAVDPPRRCASTGRVGARGAADARGGRPAARCGCWMRVAAPDAVLPRQPPGRGDRRVRAALAACAEDAVRAAVGAPLWLPRGARARSRSRSTTTADELAGLQDASPARCAA